MKRSWLLAPFLASALILAACSSDPVEIEVTREVLVTATPLPPVPENPRELQVKVGAGRDTVAINAFFPKDIRIYQGETVTWKISSDEIHTVAFMNPDDPIPAFPAPIPGGGATDLMLNPAIAFPTRLPGAPVESYSGAGFVNSGIFAEQPPAPGIPPNDTMSLTFDAAGIYPYLCLVHPGSMFGTVEVVPQEQYVPSQAEIDAQGQRDLDRLTARIDAARAQFQPRRPEPGIQGTSQWFVKAGTTELVTADPTTQILEFFPDDITIKAGDTVIWGSDYFHNITFIPSPPAPEFVIPQPQAQGPPVLRLNPDVFLPAKPSAEYDPTQYYNSADLGPFSLGGSSWALTFNDPGRYEYFCVFHRQQGMEGSIIVTVP